MIEALLRGKLPAHRAGRFFDLRRPLRTAKGRSDARLVNRPIDDELRDGVAAQGRGLAQASTKS